MKYTVEEIKTWLFLAEGWIDESIEFDVAHLRSAKAAFREGRLDDCEHHLNVVMPLIKTSPQEVFEDSVGREYCKDDPMPMPPKR